MNAWSLKKRWFVFQWQKLVRGFSDEETWSLDYSLAKHILPRLKRFKEVSIAYPSNLTPEEWDTILDKMIFAFEEVAKGDLNSFSEDDPKIQEGIDLFGKWYRALWW